MQRLENVARAAVEEGVEAAPAADPAVVELALAGLLAERKWLSPSLLYDRVGAKLFEAITLLDDYYPTRTEMGLLEAAAPAIAEALGEDVTLIEPGSGDGIKARIILDALGAAARAYVPIDIAAEQLAAVAADTAAHYPGLSVVPVAGDFNRPLDLPAEAKGENAAIFFPGSTIGNMEPDDAAAFLASLRESTGARSLVIGVDLKKDVALLERAYDDPAGVTAAFNMNVLQRLNRELSASFDLSRFSHLARYDPVRGRIEMHLRSQADQTVEIAGHAISFAAGETIHTESSYKYAPEEFQALCARAGWVEGRPFLDPDKLFSIHLFRAG